MAPAHLYDAGVSALVVRPDLMGPWVGCTTRPEHRVTSLVSAFSIDTESLLLDPKGKSAVSYSAVFGLRGRSPDF